VPNVTHQTFSIQSIKDADRVQLITFTTMRPNNVTAESHANSQDNSTLTTSANAQPIKREPEETGTNQTRLAIAHQTSHSGTVNIALLVQLEPNSIQKNINVITAQTDSSEILPVTPVFQDFDYLQIYFRELTFFVFVKDPFFYLA
jgi:hypothetical protein